MIRIPTFTLQEKKLPRVIFSIQYSASSGSEALFTLIRKVYDLGVWCFDLPSVKHLEAFRELKNLTDDESLIGVGHIDAEEGVSFLGKPLHRFEPTLASTIQKNLFPPHLIRDLKERGLWKSKRFFPTPASSQVFTQKEIDRISFDPSRFDQALSRLRPEESLFLMIGEKYGDWLSALGRVDLLQMMALKVRGKGFLPILSANWATYVLPKAKSVDVFAYAIPVNKNWSLFNLDLASKLIKKFDRCLISLDPFDNGKLLNQPAEALSFLFEELKIASAITEIPSEEEGKQILKALETFPSVRPPRKT